MPLTRERLRERLSGGPVRGAVTVHDTSHDQVRDMGHGGAVVHEMEEGEREGKEEEEQEEEERLSKAYAVNEDGEEEEEEEAEEEEEGQFKADAVNEEEEEEEEEDRTRRVDAGVAKWSERGTGCVRVTGRGGERAVKGEGGMVLRGDRMLM